MFPGWILKVIKYFNWLSKRVAWLCQMVYLGPPVPQDWPVPTSIRGLSKPLAPFWVWPLEDTRGRSGNKNRWLRVYLHLAPALVWQSLAVAVFVHQRPQAGMNIFLLSPLQVSGMIPSVLPTLLHADPSPEDVNIPCCLLLTLPTPF